MFPDQVHSKRLCHIMEIVFSRFFRSVVLEYKNIRQQFSYSNNLFPFKPACSDTIRLPTTPVKVTFQYFGNKIHMCLSYKGNI